MPFVLFARRDGRGRPAGTYAISVEPTGRISVNRDIRLNHPAHDFLLSWDYRRKQIGMKPVPRSGQLTDAYRVASGNGFSCRPFLVRIRFDYGGLAASVSLPAGWSEEHQMYIVTVPAEFLLIYKRNYKKKEGTSDAQ